MSSKVTVLLALYNGSKYIEKQLDSLYLQTRNIDQLIIGDDGSNDDSVSIVNAYIQSHHLEGKWTVIQNAGNRGHAANFINLCNMIDGEYVFFCDQDDIWMIDKVERMTAVIENDDRVQLLYGNVINTNIPENCISEKLIKHRVETKKVPFSPENYFFKGLGCAMCLRKKFIDKMLPYWTEGWEHDMFFWACAIMTNSGYYYDAPVILRRIHENNASIAGVKTLAKRCMQVEQSLSRVANLRQLLKDYSIMDISKQKFVDIYERSMENRYLALNNRNLFRAIYSFMFYPKYYLHRRKGAILDIVLIVFGKYPIK